jgi:hypothetical protein
MRRHLIHVAIAVVCLPGLACARQTDAPGAGSAPTYLFVQTSQSGTFEGDRLTLDDVAAQTVFFADRPERVAGHLPVRQFVDQWTQGANSFRSNPPNASLAFLAAGVELAVVLELHEPVLEGTRLSFRVRVLEGTLPAHFPASSLFIDAGGLMQLVAYGAQDVYGSGQ